MPEKTTQQNETPETIPVDAAVKIAVQYFSALIQHTFTDLAVEEVEKTDDDRFWLVTLGYSMPSASAPFAILTGNSTRLYKLVRIKAQTGEPISMKIRNL